MSDGHLLVAEQGDPEEASDMMLAKEIGEVLMKHYPNHPWIVSVQGGALIIRHPVIANAMMMATGREGFATVLPRDKFNTPTELTKTVVRFGGELLEAFSMKRGAWDGDQPVVPERWAKRGNSRVRYQ